MRVLVTGANGLLGCNLVRALLEDGNQVRTLVRTSSDTRGLEGLATERFVGDVRDRASVREAMDGCDAVFHAAAVFAYWGHSRQEMLSTVRDGTSIVLEAARDLSVKRVVLTSSTAVYGGSPDPTARSEEAPSRSQNGVDYFESKTLQEHLAIEMARELGVELVVVNPTVFIGPHDYRPSQSSHAFTGFLRDPFRLTYPGGACIAHVGDIARGHIVALEHARPLERNILGGENIEWRDFHGLLAVLTDSSGPRLSTHRFFAQAAAPAFEVLARMSGRPPLVTRGLARQVGLYFFHSSEKMETLGYSRRSLKSTLRSTLSWWSQSPHVSRKESIAWKPKL